MSSWATQVQVLEAALLLHQPPEIRCPTWCLSFGGTRETPSGVGRFPESNEFSGRRAPPLSSVTSVIATCLGTCTLHAVRWLRFCGNYVSRPLPGKRRKLKTRRLPQFSLCQRSVLPISCRWARNRVKICLEKVRILPFFLLSLRVIPLTLVPLLPGPSLSPSQAPA